MVATLATALVLSACAAPASLTRPTPSSKHRTPVASSPSPTPTPSATPSDVIATGTYNLTDANGYTARIDYAWHAGAPASYQEVSAMASSTTPNANCAAGWEHIMEGRGKPGDEQTMVFYRVRVTGVIAYPTTSGLRWPASEMVLLTASNFDSKTTTGGAICGKYHLDAPGAGDGSFDFSVVYGGVRTPNDPSGGIVPDVSTIKMIVSAGTTTHPVASYGN